MGNLTAFLDQPASDSLTFVLFIVHYGITRFIGAWNRH